MTPDIQELRRLAEAAKSRPLNAYSEPSMEASYFYRAASPSTLLALIEENGRLREVITRAGVQFRYYEEQHRLKGPEGEVKARVNAEMAEMCEQALDALPTPPEKSDV